MTCWRALKNPRTSRSADTSKASEAFLICSRRRLRWPAREHSRFKHDGRGKLRWCSWRTTREFSTCTAVARSISRPTLHNRSPHNDRYGSLGRTSELGDGGADVHVHRRLPAAAGRLQGSEE